MVLVLIVAGLWLAVDRSNLAGPVARYLTAKSGRKVGIANLRVRLGNPLTIEMRGGSLANVKGGSQGQMVTLAHLTADLDPWTILFGPLEIRDLTIDGAKILLEHGPDDRANWRFNPASAIDKANGRRVVPAVLRGDFRNVAIDIRTSSGAILRTRVDDMSVRAGLPDAPIVIVINGSYNDISVHADAALPAFSALYTPTTKLPVRFGLASGSLRLAFEGTSEDPLNADGLDGRMTMDAPKPGELLALAGIDGKIAVPFTLAARFSRNDTLWRLSDGTGTLDGEGLKGALRLQEGKRHQLDAIMLEAAFGRLDLNSLLPAEQPVRPAGKTSLLVAADPGATVDAHVTADHIAYRTINADAFDFKAGLAPGLLSIEQIAANIAGGSAKSRVTMRRKGQQSLVDFDGSLTKVDAAKLAQLMGWGQLPVSGPISSSVSGSMTGATLAEARGVNRIFAIVSMAGGSIDRHLVGLASTDVRSVIGLRTGQSRLTCLLAILDLRDGLGAIAPLTIRTSDGTIVGAGVYDARHDTVDITIGTRSATTSLFALDVPVRISGPVSNFNVRPAFGAARTIGASIDINTLPPELQGFAASNACPAR